MDKHEKPKSDIHQIVLNLLQEKRELLLKLQDERKLNSENNETIKKLRDELRARENLCSEERNAVSPLVSIQDSFEHCHEDSSQRQKLEIANLKDKVSKLEKNLCECRTKLVSVENQNLVLQGEVMRLARAVSKANPSVELELSREQMRIYEQDYKREKSDKDVAEKKLQDCEELLSTFTTQIELYKKAFQREKEEKEHLLRERLSNCTLTSFGCSGHSFSEEIEEGKFKSSTKSPILPAGTHCQLVHPLSESKTQEKEMKRKQELERKGILIRDSKPAPDVLYRGDVKIDQYDNS